MAYGAAGGWEEKALMLCFDWPPQPSESGKWNAKAAG